MKAERPLSFELLADLANGPTARVELCRVTSEPDKPLAAVKRLHPHVAEDPQFYAMFLDEVWMTAAIEHPNVAKVMGWGTDSEGAYLAVELIPGVSLARLMKTVFETGEAFTERLVVYMGLAICEGLRAAHQLTREDGQEAGIVHRDLTPGNVLVGFDGRVVVADFGLAKAKERLTHTLTGHLKGHPLYMAPEQAERHSVDHRADLFSLGVVLFELFSGKHPWGQSTEPIAFGLPKGPAQDLLQVRPRVDRTLAEWVAKLLERDPNKRFQSADEVYGKLQGWLRDHGHLTGGPEAVARFVRRNTMRQVRWFERAIAGELRDETVRSRTRGGAKSLASLVPSTFPKTPAPEDDAEELSLGSAVISEMGTSQDSTLNTQFSEELPTIVSPKRGRPIPDGPDTIPRSDAGDRVTAVVRRNPIGPVDDDSIELPTTPGKLRSRGPLIPMGTARLPPPPGVEPPRVRSTSLRAGTPFEDRPTIPKDAAQVETNEDSWSFPRPTSTPVPRADGAKPVVTGQADLAGEIQRLRGISKSTRAQADDFERRAQEARATFERAEKALQLAEEALRIWDERPDDAKALVQAARRTEESVEPPGVGAQVGLPPSLPPPKEALPNASVEDEFVPTRLRQDSTAGHYAASEPSPLGGLLGRSSVQNIKDWLLTDFQGVPIWVIAIFVLMFAITIGILVDALAG